MFSGLSGFRSDSMALEILARDNPLLGLWFKVIRLLLIYTCGWSQCGLVLGLAVRVGGEGLG